MYSRGRGAPSTGAAGASLHALGQALRARQDARTGSPLSVVARPVRCGGGVHQDLPYLPTHQGHLLPACLLFPLLAPTRWGGCISLYFNDLPTARSGQDFVQVHIVLLTGWSRIWKSTPVTNPPFPVICLSYACHMNTSVISFSILSYAWDILLTNNSEKIYLVYQNFELEKDMPNLKKMLLAYTKGIFSDPGLHVPGICCAYPCHKSVLFCGMLPANKIMPAIELLFDF